MLEDQVVVMQVPLAKRIEEPAESARLSRYMRASQGGAANQSSISASMAGPPQGRSIVEQL